MKLNVQFIKTALKDYKVGAVTPSSRYVVERLVRELPSGVKFVLEYGAGDGVITKGLLRVLPQDGKLVAFELNRDFVEKLQEINDPRLMVIEEDVAVASGRLWTYGLPRIDAVVSGIPFSFLKPEVRRKIAEHTHAALAPHGRFIVYQFSPLMAPHLKRSFRRMRTVLELRNFPPYFVMVGEK
jgi:phospholipid N-methyltransferase